MFSVVFLKSILKLNGVNWEFVKKIGKLDLLKTEIKWLKWNKKPPDPFKSKPSNKLLVLGLVAALAKANSLSTLSLASNVNLKSCLRKFRKSSGIL